MEKKIIAVYGGSFNPPINSHFSLAKQLLVECKKIEKIIFIPVSKSYNKKGLIADKDRYNMLKLGCESNEKFEVSDIELNKDIQPFTIDTLNSIKEKNPNNDIYFILGTDNLKELKTWHKSEELTSNYKFFILERNEDNVDEILKNDQLLKKYKNNFLKFKNIKKIKISSSLVRKKIYNGEDITEFVPAKIYKYIINHNLYR